MNVQDKDKIEAWYAAKGWKVFPFQKEMHVNIRKGNCGLLNAPTGSGKTYAMWIPILEKYLENHAYQTTACKAIWITPLRALSNDICNALQEACDFMGFNWQVEVRTGDTSSSIKQRQIKKPPQCLVTTPESIHVLLANKNSGKLFSDLDFIVVDEWHELLGSKRGTQTEILVSHLKSKNPQLKVWGISATIGNLDQAKDVLLGDHFNPHESVIVRSKTKKKTKVTSLMPDEIEKFPWGGHLGVSLLEKAVEVVNKSKTTLIFTNTRSQCELWYHAILEKYPDFAGLIAMHHGSLDRDLREWVEQALHQGLLKAVVCTSSLDLGVDFRPVESVIQIGGPKGVARFLQRAGRAGHQPGATSHIYFLPTHSLELVEGAALREAMKISYIESREPIIKPIDVLIQYLITLAVGEGFDPNWVYGHIKNSFSYRDLDPEEWAWICRFVVNGGESLKQYDEYNKLVKEGDVFRVVNHQIAMRHRLSIGTIVGDNIMKVKFMSGGTIGTIEETFISNLTKGDSFLFAGRMLELVQVKGMTAYVRKSKKAKGNVPQWMGGRMQFSSQMSEVMRNKVDEVANGIVQGPEMKKLVPLFEMQQERSAIPSKDELLIEYFKFRDGHHLVIYPFEGRLIHEVMGAVIAYRIGQIKPLTFTMGFNDYGFEMTSDIEIPILEALDKDLFSTHNLTQDIYKSVNAAESASRKFRDISVIAGLVFQGFPHRMKKTRHLQSSSSLIFKVFEDYEPENLLIRQAYNEVFIDQFDEVRLRAIFTKLRKQKVVLTYPEKVSPFSFPIITDRLRAKLSTEKIEDRVRRMLKE